MSKTLIETINLKKIISHSNIKDHEKYWLTFPENLSNQVQMTHLSFFENWDPYRNYLVAKEHCGLQDLNDTNAGTFTNFAQNDQILASLHYYLMFLKFGFGRATQDAGIEIRRGAMIRSQALNLVKMYDNNYPERFIERYLDYYKMSRNEFNKILDKWANKKLFEKKGDKWIPKFKIA